MANDWSPERRARQSELIRTWMPWEASTGPVTRQGKAIASRNADKPNSINRRLLVLEVEIKRLWKQGREIYGPRRR